MRDGDFSRFSFGKQIPVSRRILVASYPKFADLKISQHREHAAEMILVGVRYHDRIDVLQSMGPKKWRDDVFSDVETRPHPANVIGARQPAGINEHRAAVGESHENGIALANVQDSYLQAPSLQSRGKGINDDQRG